MIHLSALADPKQPNRTLPLFALSRLTLFASSLFSFSLLSLPAQATDVPQSFSLDGRLYSDAASTRPLVDDSVALRIQILDEAKVCVLYEELQYVSTVPSLGHFNIRVGSNIGDPKRAAGSDPGLTMSQVFSNASNVSGVSVTNGSPCTVTAAAGKRRFARVQVSPSSMVGGYRTLSPDLSLDSVPNAVIAERAESIEGFRSSQLLKVNESAGAVLNQNNLENLFSSSTRFNAVAALADGTSSMYMRSSASTGAQLPLTTGSPSAPSVGAIWFDQGDQRVKFQSSSGEVILATGTTGISSLGGLTSSTQTLSANAVSTAGVVQPEVVSSVNNHEFRIPLASGTGVTGGLISKTEYDLFSRKLTSPLTTKGDLLAFSTTANHIRLPAGANGQILSANSATDSGLQWITPSAGTLTSISSTNAYLTVDNGDSTSTITANVGTTANTLAAGNDSRIDGALQITDYNNDVADAASCTAAEAPYWNSVSGKWMCGSIANLPATSINSGIFSTARLGSGTANSSTFLRGDGTWTSLSGLPAADGTVTAPGISFASSLGTGLYVPYSGAIGFSTGGFNRFTLDSNAFYGGQVYLNPNTPNATNPTYAFLGDADTGIWGPAANTLSFVTGGNERIQIDSSGNVGIGTAPALAKLNVTSNVNASDGIVVRNMNTGSSAYAGVALMSDRSRNGEIMFLDQDNTTLPSGWLGYNHSTNTMYFGTSEVANRMVINASGNVGVRTTDPQAHLDVNGYMRLAKNAAQPVACSATNDGAIALTSAYTMCVCKGSVSTWVSTTDGTTACSWGDSL